MSNKILTISVAAYNVEKTLSKTLDSFNPQFTIQVQHPDD